MKKNQGELFTWNEKNSRENEKQIEQSGVMWEYVRRES